MDGKDAVIRRREVPSRRRRDGLIGFARDVTSQNGEDGILERLFELLPKSSSSFKYCVDVGAWDGVHLSNTYSLLVKSGCWRGILIEADVGRFQELRALHEPLGNTCLNLAVSALEDSPNTLVSLLHQNASTVELPFEFDLLCIDIDGSDYWVWHDVLQSGEFRPKVVVIEFNPTMPDDLIYIPSRSDTIRHGASLAALVELAQGHDYVLVETTLYNAIFVTKTLYESHLTTHVPDTSIEALHETTMGTTLYQLYDGTIKLWGCKKLLWHRLPMDESKLQILPPDQRTFPFAPDASDDFDMSVAVDMTPYFASKENIDKRVICAEQVLDHLRSDGFCYVCGTGISQTVCQKALRATNAFLQEADESVRRSCLTKDRARRGYSPMNSENFSSLVGEQGPNDLVRKFRMGPVRHGDNSLLQPNVWPTTDWDAASDFQSAVEAYYEAAREAAHTIVGAICDGLLAECPDLAQSLQPLANWRDENTDTSILTLLGYKSGTRHKGKKKGPLVAAHTDVGIITFLLFDSGDCAMLQRSNDKGRWVDVSLPKCVPEDPIFVVNVADCFSELSCGKLPSTLHRVVAKPGRTTPRNCLALFVGLDPEERLYIQGQEMSYEEWRKQRIARAQSILKSAEKKT